jgi:uncharacterized caspase-like protein
MGVMRRLSVIWACILLAVGIFGLSGPALAQQQEKRIALVIGNGAYAKSPLATAANDGGLIAQTLQAAGFDVVGARDLDGDTLRRSFRDFVQKAQSSGPDTVAMVYLAGHGLQLAGENYFIPVDSAIGRETDIPTEALRISDYVRQLGSLPLKASIVVLDVAREQSFVEGGQPIAGGLALVEPEANMLVAFNAAPGTVAPAEQGPYGIYAQSLAEMVRTGGLPLPELFDRVRLRVNDASKGAQVPWHAHKITTSFMFFDRAPDAPPQAPPDQAAAVRNKPIRDVGAQDAYAMALERDTLQGYDEFLTAYPSDPLARRVRALAAARREAITWMRTYRADTPQAYWSYLRRYPQGPHAADARRRLAILTAPLEPPPAFAVIDYDVPPPPPEEIVYVDRPVLAFNDPYYDFAPPPPPPVYFLPPPPPDFVVLEPPPPPIGLFILPQPLFVPIPVYVRPPIYVAAPPNNIIYANIHNTTVINNVINRPAPPQGGPGPGQGTPGGAGFRAGLNSVAAPGAASPALPPSVAQRASLIREGKAPVPPSASINPAVRPAAPAGPAGATTALQPANAPPLTPQGQSFPRANTLPGTKGAPGPAGATTAVQPANAPPVTPQSQPLPRANALPVPGAKGAPPAPAGAATGAGVNPNVRTTSPSTPPPGTTPAPGTPAASTAAKPLPANAPPVAGTPRPSGSPGGAGPAPRQGAISALPPPPASNVGKPPSGVTSAPTPPPSVQPAARTPPAPAPRIATPSPPPPPRVSAPPPPPPRVSAPPPPAPRMAAPSPPPPPPRVSAPPPPPQRMAAPPPPAPRMAAPAPPPPRPVAPPPAAAKRCPPNVPRC